MSKEISNTDYILTRISELEDELEGTPNDEILEELRILKEMVKL